MILLQSRSRFLLQILLNRVQNPERVVEMDCHSVEFDDIRYHIQFSVRDPHSILLSMSLPTPPPETIFFDGLPFGGIEAIKAAYGGVVQILDPPKDGYNLTMKLNLSKLPPDEGQRYAFLVKIASLREVVLGAPLRIVLKHLASKTVAPDIDRLVALLHRPKESFFVIPQEFVEARRAAGLNTAPSCLWSPSPPTELKEAPDEALSANAGFVTFGNNATVSHSIYSSFSFVYLTSSSLFQ
ncbi:unnamed protein product [Victoria cruziana]